MECAAIGILYSRTGYELQILPEMLTHLQLIAIDGELWFGRNNFELTYQLVNRNSKLTYWDALRLIAFEGISRESLRYPVETRYMQVLRNTLVDNPVAIVACRLVLPRSDLLNELALLIIDHGGEGAILQKFESSYESGRSHSVLKFKMMLEDREGVIVKRDNKAVHLKLPNGMLIVVPTENVHLANLAVGDVVTFSCKNYTNRHTPVNPVIHRWRTDVSWRDVMRLYMQEQRFLTLDEMRQFMVDFATKRFLDPTLAETWYSIKDSEIFPYKGRKILKLFKGYAKAVLELFPEISFERIRLNKSMWKVGDSKRKVFERFAKENNFDPLIAENWYLQRKRKLLASPDVYRVIEGIYSNNVSKALMDLFPEIGFEKCEFTQRSDPNTRRRFFEKYAQANGFDPLNPENWYTQSKKRILAAQGSRHIIWHHGSITKSLLDLFPDIGLDKANLIRSQWRNRSRQRKYFEEYAKENDFDPLDPKNWYSHAEKIRKLKNARRIFSYHNTSLSATLIDLFPEVEFKRVKFRKQLFQNPLKRKLFFEKYALENNFDPLVPENWYNVSHQKILASKGAYTVMDYHRNSTSKALIDLFPDIGLEASKFWKSPLHEASKRRAFFENYAKGKFDPLVPENWHSQPTSQLMQIKGVHNVLRYHKGGISSVLLELFPEIGLHKTSAVV